MAWLVLFALAGMKTVSQTLQWTKQLCQESLKSSPSVHSQVDCCGLQQMDQSPDLYGFILNANAKSIFDPDAKCGLSSETTGFL